LFVESTHLGNSESCLMDDVLHPTIWSWRTLEYATRRLNACKADMNCRSPQLSTMHCSNGGFPSSLSVRKRCLPVLPNIKWMMQLAKFSIAVTPKRKGTCLFPLEPRCGDATVMKFTASSPYIVPLLSSVKFCWAFSDVCLGGLYSLPIAYLATNPPTECATKDIFLISGLLLISSITCLTKFCHHFAEGTHKV